MKKFIKQLFCRHLYEDGKARFLGNIRELGVINYSTYARYAVDQKCIKCEKKRFVYIRELVLTSIEDK